MRRADPLPAALDARARAFLASAQPVVAPTRDAATVVLLRDGARGVEVYLLRRVARMAFAAGMHVFPGGAVDPRDRTNAVPWAGPPPQAWAARLSADAQLSRALGCAAVRETFEECGVLLAGPDSASVVADTTGAEWESARSALEQRRLALRELLEHRGLVLRADLLEPWSHWVTAEFEERRYDTRFFVALLPTGQRTRAVGGEADRVAWLPVRDAVAGFEDGRLAMLPPTIVTLRELAPYAHAADVLAAAAQRPIRPLLPRPVLRDGEVRLLLPGEPGYPS